jgi:hypothetical protein
MPRAKSLPPVVVPPPAPSPSDVARDMKAFAPNAAPAASSSPPPASTPDAPGVKRDKTGRRRDYAAEHAARKEAALRKAREALGGPAPVPGAPVERSLRPEDMAPRAANGMPLDEWERGVKNLAGAIRMIGEGAAAIWGNEWRVTDDAPDNDATNLARVMAEAWPELLAELGKTPQLIAILTLGAMFSSRYAAWKTRKLAQATPVESVVVEPVNPTAGAPVTAPVEGNGAPPASWNERVRRA